MQNLTFVPNSGRGKIKMQNDNSKFKIIFFGTSDFAIPALETLAKDNYDVVAVVTKPDKPAGRKQVLSPSPVKKFAIEKHILVLEPNNLRGDEEVFAAFKLLSPDVCVVAAYGKIIPKRYLGVPKYGFINIHPSLLPKYRGPSPIQTAILSGEKETGVTILVVDEEMDHGPILKSEKWKVKNGKYYKELEKELAELGAKLLIETLPKYINGEIKQAPQDHSRATFTKMFSREDGRVDWSKSTQEIYNRIRALNPEPGTWTLWKGKVLNIKKARLADGKLEIETLQLEGKRETPFREFLNGHPDFDISQLE